MLEHFNADDFIKFLIPARECLRARCDSAKRQAALLQQLQAVRIKFQPSPLMPGRNQPRSVSAGPASDIEDRASSREIIEDKAQYLGAGFQHWRARAINIFAVQHQALHRENHLPETPFLEATRHQTDRYLPN
jgi:hypothetical protein